MIEDAVERVARAIEEAIGTSGNYLVAHMTARRAAIAALAAAPEERLREALEPFAKASDDYDREGPDAWADEDEIADTHFTVGQLRNARAALKATAK